MEEAGAALCGACFQTTLQPRQLLCVWNASGGWFDQLWLVCVVLLAFSKRILFIDICSQVGEGRTALPMGSRELHLLHWVRPEQPKDPAPLLGHSVLMFLLRLKRCSLLSASKCSIA